jgi:hypothetical protein
VCVLNTNEIISAELICLDKGKDGLFDLWPKRLDRVECKRIAPSRVGVQKPDSRMRATRRERGGEPPDCHGKDHVQKRVERMRSMSLRPGLTIRSRSS